MATKKTGKLKLAFYWAASCGGCEIAVLEIGAKILDVVAVADIVFWPCITDFKRHHVEGYPDGFIDVCFFNGGIRTSEQEKIAQLLRKKSKTLVAYGACSHMGGIPALANQSSREGVFERVYNDNPSTVNPERVVPLTESTVNGRELELPAFYDEVLRLSDVVEVDYFVPGCPPTEKMTWAAIEAIIGGKLPPAPALVGVGDKAVCDECPNERRQTPIQKIERPHLFVPEPGWCLLEQGLVCMGPATRSGCEARCLQAGLPCRGCYGAAGDAVDQGAKMISALASMVGGEDDDEGQQILSQLVDPTGSFYRFGMSSSLLVRKRLDPGMEG